MALAAVLAVEVLSAIVHRPGLEAETPHDWEQFTVDGTTVPASMRHWGVPHPATRRSVVAMFTYGIPLGVNGVEGPPFERSSTLQ